MLTAQTTALCTRQHVMYSGTRVVLHFINIIIYSLVALPYSRAELSMAHVCPGTPKRKNALLHAVLNLESFASVNDLSGKFMWELLRFCSYLKKKKKLSY